MNLNLKHWMFSLFLLLFVIEVFSVLPHRLGPQEPLLSTNNQTESVYLKGLFNVRVPKQGAHSSLASIAELAQSKGMDFVIIGEPVNSPSISLESAKRFGKTDLFIELADKTPAGSLFIFFSHTPLSRSPLNEVLQAGYQKAIGETPSSPLVVSVSHPTHPRNPWGKLDQFPDGIELVNYDSAFWRRLYSNPLDFFGIALIYPLNPFLSSLRFVQPFSKDLAYWDNMNSLDKPRFGLFSSQFTPHFTFSFFDFSWPTLSDLFGFASNVVFLENQPESTFSGRKKQIYQSIKEGRLAIAYHSIFPFEGNDFSIQCGNHTLRSGQSASFQKDCKAVIQIPKSFPYRAQVKLFRNGILYAEDLMNSSGKVQFSISERGPYRAEIWARPHTLFWVLLRKWVPYILYNPVFIK